jgi:hypothetical protein
MYLYRGKLRSGPDCRICAISHCMNPEEIMRRIELLRQEHRDLDTAITALAESGARDQLQLARLKKRKLMLKDEISMLEDQLIPDIIA